MIFARGHFEFLQFGVPRWLPSAITYNSTEPEMDNILITVLLASLVSLGGVYIAFRLCNTSAQYVPGFLLGILEHVSGTPCLAPFGVPG